MSEGKSAKWPEEALVLKLSYWLQWRCFAALIDVKWTEVAQRSWAEPQRATLQIRFYEYYRV